MKDKSNEVRTSFNPCTQELIDANEDIVISGVAGRFPESDNVRHLQENLFNKLNLITDQKMRWSIQHPDIPKGTGKVNNIQKFDASFFDINSKQAHTMDPMSRMLLEHTYEAIIDAGINPRQLRGTRTGVFIGSCISETEKTWIYEKIQANGLGITGCSRSMLPNKISYHFDFVGPSYAVDTACSSSLYAMENAYRALRSGLCDAAIVGGNNLCLHPQISLAFFRLGVTSPDYSCKCFDNGANGYARSETISVILLQKFKDAKRVYATVVHGKTNCDGFKPQGITYPSSHLQKSLLVDFYKECKILPNTLEYVEAHGTGTQVGDPEELSAIEDVFCTGRNGPLKLGSVKSNLGHAEAASGMCSIIKVVIANETGLIPPNIHYKNPREGIKALLDGRIQVVTEPTPWAGGHIAISSFGFGGANAHILLKSNPKKKINGGAPEDDLPRLVVISGRTEEAVENIFRDICSRPLDIELVKLFHDVHAENICGHPYRGYIILRKNTSSEKLVQVINHYDEMVRPVWFVFSGLGSQWPGMGNALLLLPVFAEAIKKCDNVLKSRGVDIYDILTNTKKSTFDNILYSTVGIAAVQIGLVDLLKSINIFPDNIIGYSLGELGCAYADGCFTTEETILAAYFRGLASLEAKAVRGAMTNIGLGYKDIKDICPPDIEVACHNSADSSTISGPAESIKTFVAKLKANKIFTQEVPCGNIAYHSRYIADAGPKLLKYLKEVISKPKMRSTKWVSTSVPHNQWTKVEARFSSAEYHTNNFLSPVLFEETSNMIPHNAVMIEIAPHGILQSMIKKSFDPRIANISLMQHGHNNNVEVFLQSVGELYNVGLQPLISNLYPKVQFPVSRGTPMISPLIKWDHSYDWFIYQFKEQDKLECSVRTVEVDLTDEVFEYMVGHVIDGRNLLPATGYLILAWETLAMIEGELYEGVSVVFRDVKFLRATTIPQQGSLTLSIMVHKGTGRFEVSEGDAAVVTGYIHLTSNPSAEKMNPTLPKSDEEEVVSNKDFYKELKLRGYHYDGLFRGVNSCTISGSKGKIAWVNNWVAFMDNMLQVQIVGMDSRGLFVPTGIQKLVIDTKAHYEQLQSTTEEKEYPVYSMKMYDLIVAGGVEIRGLKASAISRRKMDSEPVLETYKFVAHRDCAEMSMKEAVHLATHLALENHLSIKIKTLEMVKESENSIDNLLSLFILETLANLPLLQADVNVLSDIKAFKSDDIPENINFIEPRRLPANANALLLCGHNLLTETKECELMSQLLVALKDDGFVLTLESGSVNDLLVSAKNHNLNIIIEKIVGKSKLLLLRRQIELPKDSKVVKVSNNSFEWVEELKSTLKLEIERGQSKSARIFVVGEKEFENGALGLVNCLRRELGGEMIRGVLIQDENAPNFSMSDSLYANQLNLNLAFNVLRSNGEWGSYRHFPLPEKVPCLFVHAQANQLVRGDLSSFQWSQGPIEPGYTNPNLARIVYSALNFRDVMLATGKLAAEVVVKSRMQQDCIIGFEFSGIDSTGRKIMGISSRAFANQAVIDPDLSWYVPKDWTLEDAATVPCVYATSYYALYISGKMKKNDKVLIHAGSGGVGQSAIQLALNDGCEVFTTVGTPEKRRFIKERFPQIPDSHIGNSRDSSFEQLILKETNGRGVDIVLNSLAEEKLQASIRCLAVGGRFLEIGKFDMANDSKLGMSLFLKGISFHGILLDNLFDAPPERKVHLTKLFQKGLDSGSIKPLTRTVFPRDQIEEAFRYMGAGKHMGKVLVKILDEKNLEEISIPALPRYYCLPDRSYVILGGFGGFGLELIDWLILRGARNLVITSRTGFKNGYQRMRVGLWRSYGARIEIVSGKNVADRKDCAEILKAATDMAPIDGIFNLAVVLKDALLENQTSSQFAESFEPKAWSTKILDELSRKVCPQLRHFVVFSSVSCGRGNAGQTNYGMSNSVMERICEKRVAEGFPALAIQWGAIGDVGLVADMQDKNQELVIGGTLQQKISSCLQELDGFLTQDSPIVSSMIVAEKKIGGSGSLNIVETVQHIMNIKNLKSISHQIPLTELGMDSMMGVEIKQTLEREFELFLTAQDIRDLNFAKLLEMSQSPSDEEIKVEEDGKEIIVGMGMLIRLLGKESIKTDAPMKLKTKEEAGRSEIFVIPGLEGSGSIFLNLAKQMKSPATSLQLNNAHTDYLSIPDIANNLLPNIMKQTSRRDFVIVGYSFGSLVAIELVRQLEAKGFKGKLILIDGGPELMKAAKQVFFSVSNNEELQIHFLIAIIDMIAPVLKDGLLNKLQQCSSWQEKLDNSIGLLPPDLLSMSEKDHRNICTSIYNRLVAIDNYDVSNLSPIQTPILLLKPSTAIVKNIDHDYGLSKITRGKVEVHTVEGNHATILDNIKIAMALNEEPFEDAV
ncbi:hypothetical protein PV328_000726 [Microctonus aethiopoides]|uniref:Uncharacterized protein n=2 Tax=Microctonus aethiopoides TaxID=144406 RepID=A0AA39KWU3_9HYME|nr:hypothetical protein PV328_000726 [Microctonus aethiopoides]